MAEKLDLPRAALSGQDDFEFLTSPSPERIDQHRHQPTAISFADPDPFQEFTYPNAIFAKRAIADYLGLPLTKLAAAQRSFVDQVVAESLNKKIIMERVENYFHPSRSALPVTESLEEAEEYVN